MDKTKATERTYRDLFGGQADLLDFFEKISRLALGGCRDANAEHEPPKFKEPSERTKICIFVGEKCVFGIPMDTAFEGDEQLFADALKEFHASCV